VRKVHLIVGIAGFAAFVLSGQYMRWVLHVYEMEPAPRMFVRSGHLYLMWASALNIALGCFLVEPRDRALHIGQWIASLAIVAAPLLLCASFLLEPYNPDLHRFMARYANMLSFGGISATLLIRWLSRPRTALEAHGSPP